MDVTTFVLLWDDVFAQLLEEIKAVITQSNEDMLPILLEKVVLQPLQKMLLSAINFLTQLLQNPYLYTFWHELIEQLLLLLYVGLLIYVGMQMILALYRCMIKLTINESMKYTIIQPLVKLLLLQCIHFIGYPLINAFLSYYPKIIKYMYECIGHKASTYVLALSLPKEYILLEILCLAMLFVLLLLITLQFIQRGIMIVFPYIHCYILIAYTADVSIIFAPIKTLIFPIFIIFVLQQLLLQECFTYFKNIVDIVDLFYIISICYLVLRLPKILSGYIDGKEFPTWKNTPKYYKNNDSYCDLRLYLSRITTGRHN